MWDPSDFTLQELRFDKRLERLFAHGRLDATWAPHLFEVQAQISPFDVLCAKTFLDLFMKWRVDSALQKRSGERSRVRIERGESVPL